MLVKFLLLAYCAAAFVQGDEYEALKKVTSEQHVKLCQVVDKTANATRDYPDMIKERFECLQWEHMTQFQNVNDSITTAVFKGMLRNNKFTNFQCISKIALETLEKIRNSYLRLENNKENITDTWLNNVTPLWMNGPPLSSYIRNLYNSSVEQMKKAKNEEERKKILESVQNKMKNLDTVLNEMDKYVATNKFKFFEDFVKFAYNTENKIKTIAREGGQKMLKCVT